MGDAPLWQYELRRNGGTSTVALAGELDLLCADEVRHLLIDEARHPDVAAVTVDLARVSFLDSTALSCLVAGYHAARAQGRPLRVVNLSATAREIFAVTGLLTVLSPTT